MSQTFFACGCIVSDGIRSVDCGTHGADHPDPIAEAVAPAPAEKKADKKAAKDA